jgi:mono/diheme cytochrome c family protein/sRNA-binding regulator protein Hfq
MGCRAVVKRAVAAAFVSAVCLAAQANSKQANENPKNRLEKGRDFLGLAPPADAEAAVRGAKAYTQACAFCHGPKATGAEGPDLLRSSIVLHDEKGDTLGPFLQKGRPDKGMPAFASLSRAQSYDIAEFLHDRVEAAANRWGYKVQNVVTGDAKAGEFYFNGTGQCQFCHSVSGDLAHIGKMDATDLQATFLYPDKNNPKTEVTVTLPSGEKITGTLKRMDDFELSMYDSAGIYRSFAIDSVKFILQDPLARHRELLAKYSDADMHNLLAYLVTLK